MIYNEDWFTSDKPHEVLSSFIMNLKNNSSERIEADAKYLLNYGQSPFSFANIFSSKTINSNTNLNLNVVQNCIDTLLAKVVKNKIIPTALSDGGDYLNQQKIKNLNKYIKGLFYKINFHPVATEVLKDCLLFGTGVMKIYKDDSEIAIERVLPSEILVDDNDALYGKPKSLYQIKLIPKSTLIKMFPEFETQIDIELNISTSYNSNTPLVQVIEAWNLPFKKAKGKHIIVINSCTLFEEEYLQKDFPFIFLRYNQLPLGFFGQGISSILDGIQTEITRLVQFHQKMMKLCSIPRIFVEKGSEIKASHLTNEVGSIVYFTGNQPILSSGHQMPSDTFNKLSDLYHKAFEIVGISQMSATSVNQLGANASGKALRTLSDIETERFQVLGQSWQQFHIKACYHMVGILNEIVSDGEGDLIVSSYDRNNGLEKIDYNTIEVIADSLVIQVFPTSSLPSEPSAKLQTISEMMEKGFIDTSTALDLLDFPDLDSANNLLQSNYKFIKKSIEKMIENFVYEAPSEYLDLQLSKKLATQYYANSLINNSSEDVLQILRDYINECDRLISKNTPPPAPPPAPAPSVI